MIFVGGMKLKRNTVNQKMVKLVDKTKCHELIKSLTKLCIKTYYYGPKHK